MLVDDPRTTRVIAILGGVRDRVPHVGDAALIDQVDDQLHFVTALEIGHLRRIAGLDQGLESGEDQRGEPAAQHGLLAEQIGLAFLAERRLDDPGPAAADRRGVTQRDFERVAGRVLLDRDEAGNAAAAQVLRAHRVARPLRRDHEHVHVGTRLDQTEMDAEAVRESERRAFTHVGAQLAGIEGGLQFVGRQHHDDVRPFGGLCRIHHAQSRLLGLLDRSRAGPQRHDDFLDPAVAQIVGMRMALAAVADDCDLLRLDQVHVGIPVVIHAHFAVLPPVPSRRRPGPISRNRYRPSPVK